MAQAENILLLFDSPLDPFFIPKGKDGKVFVAPKGWRVSDYEVNEAFLGGDGEESKTIIVSDLAVLPDLTIPMQLRRDENFSTFHPHHGRIASRLIKIFMSARDVDELQSLAVYTRDRINSQLYNYALSVALLHRDDTKGVQIPSYVENFPTKFMDSRILTHAREQASFVKKHDRKPIVIPIDFSQSYMDEEHRLWYFREDIGVNSHHYHWHLVYPTEAEDKSIVNKDRRGELFYYMHQQIMARYNFERLCLHLNRVKPLSDLSLEISEGYFPKLDTSTGSRSYPGRSAGTFMKDINRVVDDLKFEINDLRRWRERILEAVASAVVVDSTGKSIMLDERHGIDLLGNIVEASTLSVNRKLYGNLHNWGHLAISYAQDPDGSQLESFGVMGASETAMRDPVFYRWHAFINDIFQAHKEHLTPYTFDQLNYPGITIESIKVTSVDKPANTFYTHLKQDDINLSFGLNFVSKDEVFARFTHLDHIAYQIQMKVNSTFPGVRKGTVRIFLAPKLNENRTAFQFNEQRLLMIELDKFIVELNPGQNVLVRESADSSVTIPFFGPEANKPKTDDYCGCGWPQHMLIPKGMHEGKESQLFAMISNYSEDHVDQGLVGKTCNSGSTYCGLRNSKYPDRRAMGYPFDRSLREFKDENKKDLKSFLTPNMICKDVKIFFIDEDDVAHKSKG